MGRQSNGSGSQEACAWVQSFPVTVQPGLTSCLFLWTSFSPDVNVSGLNSRISKVPSGFKLLRNKSILKSFKGTVIISSSNLHYTLFDHFKLNCYHASLSLHPAVSYCCSSANCFCMSGVYCGPGGRIPRNGACPR